MADSCGADTKANELLDSLMEGKDWVVPDIDLSDPIYQLPAEVDYPLTAPLTIADLTTKVVDGTGAFDALMTSLGAHLRKEYDAQRITGNEYTKAYIGVVTAALSTATQFLLGKDQAYWAGIMAKEQARTAQIGVITARVQLEMIKYQGLNAQAEFGLTKLKLASEDAGYCILLAQKEGVIQDNIGKTFTNTDLLPIQKNLLTEQVNVQMAQTKNFRLDGSNVEGVMKSQKDLWLQQITSYQRDAEVKAAKPFIDAWITMKTIDEGLNPPNGFTNANLDTILTSLKTKNGI